MKGHNLRARASWAARSMSRRRRAAEHLPSLTARDARTHTTTHVCSPSSASAAGVDTQHKRHPLTRCFCQRGVQHRGAGEHVGLCCTACQQIEHDAHHSERMQAIRMEINSVLMRELPHTATAALLLDRLEPRKSAHTGRPRRHEVTVLLCPCADCFASQSCPPPVPRRMRRVDGNRPGGPTQEVCGALGTGLGGPCGDGV